MIHHIVTTFEAYGPFSEFDGFTSRLETVLHENRNVLAASVGSVKDARLVSVTLLVEAVDQEEAERRTMRVISRSVRRAGLRGSGWTSNRRVAASFFAF